MPVDLFSVPDEGRPPPLSRRALVSSLGLGIAALGIEALGARAFAGDLASPKDPIVTRFERSVHPDLWPFIATGYELAQRKYSAKTLPSLRAQAGYAEPLAAPAWREQVIAGPKDAPDLRVYVIGQGAPGDEPRPAILHIHGGGFVAGEARFWLRSLQETAQALSALIVTVDYRLAPETPYPGALEDNYAALRWLHANAEALGVDRRRITVMGESAGGGHAAMLSLAARDRGEISIRYQMLIYPMLDDRTGSTRHPTGVEGALWWSAKQNAFGWSALLGRPAGGRSAPAGAVPARVRDLRCLPPTFIGVGSIDLFVDEDLDYARRLIDAGVPTELVVVPGAFHGFINLRGAAVTETFRAQQIAALRRAMAPEGG
jgi:acetyl esterase/lipase